jgi:hypothetical protein
LYPDVETAPVLLFSVPDKEIFPVPLFVMFIPFVPVWSIVLFFSKTMLPELLLVMFKPLLETVFPS